MDLKIILGVVIIVIILYLIWTYFFTSVTMLMSFQSADTLNCVSGKAVSQSGKNNYSFSVWTYIYDWTGSYGNEKNIICIRSSTQKGPMGNPVNLFRLYLDKNRNDLHIYAQPTGSALSDPIKPTCSITNFPVQAWVNISISVYNRAVDIYMDGKLVRTCSLDNVASPIDSGSTIYIGGGSAGNSSSSKCSGGGSDLNGFTGYIASVVYNPDIISPQDAWNTYAKGYTNSTFGMGNLFQRYKLEFSFLKDNNILKSYTI